MIVARFLLQLSTSLEEERWAEVAKYLRDAQAPFLLLRRTWREDVYTRGMGQTDGREDGFQASKITAIVQDDFFAVWWDAQLKIRDLIYKMLRWCEGCPCHWPFMVGVSSYRVEQNLRREISCPKDVPCRCPMMGARAPEIVDGELERMALKLQDDGYREFMQTCPIRLSSSDWDRICYDCGNWWLGKLIF